MPDKLIKHILNDFLNKVGFIDKPLFSEIPISRLYGGKSKAKLFKFNIGDSYFVLRILPETTDYSTRMHQIILAKMAGEIRVGPEVFYIEPNLRAVIMRFISGREARPEDFQNAILMDKMVDMLQELHQNKCMFPVAVSPYERFNKFIQKCSSQSVQLNQMKKYMDEIEQVLMLYPVIKTNTHLDLHLSNILISDDNDICFVDWVNGGVSDPFFDLTTFSLFSKLDHFQTINFLTSYFKRTPTEIEWARFNVILPVRLMVIAAAFFSNNPNSTDTKNYSEMSLQLLNKEEFLQSLKFLKINL